MSRIRSAGQDVPEMVQIVSLMPELVTPRPEDVGVAFGSEGEVVGMGEEAEDGLLLLLTADREAIEGRKALLGSLEG
jgi:hypothetical protein